MEEEQKNREKRSKIQSILRQMWECGTTNVIFTSCVLFTTKKKPQKNKQNEKKNNRNSESSTLYRFYTINNNEKKKKNKRPFPQDFEYLV